MDNFKDFTGKDLDNAIAEACAYFDAEREQLEVEIIQDAKSGIFGLVGARKAMIRARRAQLRMPANDISPRAKSDAPKEKVAETKPSEKEVLKQTPEKKEAKAPEKKAEPKQDEQQAEPKTSAPKAEPKQSEPKQSESRQAEQSAPMEANSEDADEEESTPRIPFEDLDQDQLKEISEEVISSIIMPIVGMVPITVNIEDARVCIGLDCGDDSGLLIGREGQTLASLQYIASRIISRKMQTSVRVQLDAGDYRTRQDDKLRDLVLYLAERVRTTGKSHSTRPLSSYHRRIVHVVLQDCTDLITRSSGDGPLKRVVIQRKRVQH